VKALEKKAATHGKNVNRITQAKERVMRVAREISRQTIGFDSSMESTD
jgi:hypothetical protein